MITLDTLNKIAEIDNTCM